MNVLIPSYQLGLKLAKDFIFQKIIRTKLTVSKGSISSICKQRNSPLYLCIYRQLLGIEPV